MTYINCKTPEGVETIDEFDTRKEALKMVKVYRLAYKGTGLFPYLSSRCTKEWRNQK